MKAFSANTNIPSVMIDEEAYQQLTSTFVISDVAVFEITPLYISLEVVGSDLIEDDSLKNNIDATKALNNKGGVSMKTTIWKNILPLSLLGIIMLMTFLMTACEGHTTDQSEPAMNTIKAYDLSEEQHSLMSIVAPDAESAIVEFAADGTYKSACVGYDYYEKGVLVAKNCAESKMPFACDGESEETHGKICSYINDDDAVINILVGRSAVEETDSQRYGKTRRKSAS